MTGAERNYCSRNLLTTNLLARLQAALARYVCVSFAAVVLAAGSRVFAEQFRVHRLFPISIAADMPDAKKIVTGINDSIAIFLPDDMTYIAGLEVLVEIPDEVAEWRDSVALSLYDGIDPTPSESIIDYIGERVFVRALPNRVSWALRVPLASINAVKESAYAQKADVVPDTSAGFVFVRLQPAMKGIPDETMEAQLKVAVRPLLLAVGQLSLTVSAPGEMTFSLFIDNVKTAYQETPYLLTAGSHEVAISSDLYRGEVRTVNVDTAKTTALDIALKSVEPTMTVTAPDNTVVTLDDEPCIVGKEFATTAGEHTIKYRIGDYEIVRTITIERGKSYNADLSMDLKLTEE